MKKVLAILTLPVFVWLYSCTGTKPPVLTPTEVIQQAHEALPKAPEAPYVITPTDPRLVPVAPKPATKKHAPTVRPLPRPRPHVDQKAMETLPPQQGLICIFPFNLVPMCYPGPNQ